MMCSISKIVFSILALIIYVKLYGTSYPLKRLSHVDERNKLEIKYNLTNSAKGKAAVKVAIDHVLKQEKLSKSIVSTSYDISERNFDVNATLPLCTVSYDSIVSEGMFAYLGKDVQPPYKDNCWIRRIRYHTAPVCEKKETEAEIVPFYRWQWMLKSAYQGKCKMPSSSIIDAAASYLKNQAKTKAGLRSTEALGSKDSLYHDAPGTTVNIIMLGLSFMGQPFQSLVCLNMQNVDMASSYGSSMNHKERIYASNFTQNNGICTGYPPDHVADFYPPELHGSEYPIPVQNGQGCNVDHSLMVFTGKPSTSFSAAATTTAVKHITVRICYKYLFNMPKNIKAGSPLPCNFKWADVDVIFSFEDMKDFQAIYFPRTGAVPTNLKHLHMVKIGDIYQGLLQSQANVAYRAHKFRPLEAEHIQAKPKNCERPDIHYRLPGITDHAVTVWMSLLATGLHHTEGYIEAKDGSSSNSAHATTTTPPSSACIRGTCAAAKIGEVKFYHT